MVRHPWGPNTPGSVRRKAALHVPDGVTKPASGCEGERETCRHERDRPLPTGAIMRALGRVDGARVRRKCCEGKPTPSRDDWSVAWTAALLLRTTSTFLVAATGGCATWCRRWDRAATPSGWSRFSSDEEHGVDVLRYWRRGEVGCPGVESFDVREVCDRVRPARPIADRHQH